jgi:hypothetical protein
MILDGKHGASRTANDSLAHDCKFEESLGDILLESVAETLSVWRLDVST